MVIYSCPECGSPDVLRDAYAAWDPEENDWILYASFDYFICNNCDAEDIRPVEEPYHEV